MPSRSRRPDSLRALCAQPAADDGVDPRDDKRRRAHELEKPDRKLRQLCKQVARTLQLTLAALPDTAACLGLQVQSVDPAPNAGRLCAVIAVADPTQRAHVETVLQHRAGDLRADVAAAITRKRAPELAFHVIVTGAAHE